MVFMTEEIMDSFIGLTKNFTFSQLGSWSYDVYFFILIDTEEEVDEWWRLLNGVFLN